MPLVPSRSRIVAQVVRTLYDSQRSVPGSGQQSQGPQPARLQGSDSVDTPAAEHSAPSLRTVTLMVSVPGAHAPTSPCKLNGAHKKNKQCTRQQVPPGHKGEKHALASQNRAQQRKRDKQGKNDGNNHSRNENSQENECGSSWHHSRKTLCDQK